MGLSCAQRNIDTGIRLEIVDDIRLEIPRDGGLAEPRDIEMRLMRQPNSG